MRLGLLGGTFDPIHCGHLQAARAAREHLALDRVLFIPSRVPPHRSRLPHASGHHRFAMIAIAVLGQEGFTVSDLELSRTGPSYSHETLLALHREGWSATQLFFIIGVDAFAEIATWHAYPAVLEASHFAVVTRPGHSQEQLRTRLPELGRRFVECGTSRAASALDGPTTAIVLIDTPTANISSTDIRRRLQAGDSLDDVVPADVERHIRQHQLYSRLPAVSHLHGQI